MVGGRLDLVLILRPEVRGLKPGITAAMIPVYDITCVSLRIIKQIEQHLPVYM